MTRTKRGYILINGKKHFVYDGLNIIGRNKIATVIIPDVSVSHYHATIIIIDNNHYLSDITSRNGTYLKELKLKTLELYQLNTEEELKFGSVKVSYCKSINDFDVTVANEEDEQMKYEEDIFNAKTQVYDFSEINKAVENVNPQKSSTEEEISSSKMACINDMPTQVYENPNDDELETIAEHKEKSLNFGKTPQTTRILADETLINDLPTQIVSLAKENDTETEKENASVADVSIHSLPTQLMCSKKDDFIVSPSKIPDSDQSSTNVIDETKLDDDDESSRESTDFLTMQPAVTQNFNSDSQSQLFVQQLQRRVRYAISSSDEESREGSRESSQKRKPSKAPLEKERESSDDETDVEYSQINIKKLSKKPVLNSDSDGDSTDVELPNVLAEEKINASTKIDDPGRSHISSNAGIPSENKRLSTLDDSDIIPTTQDYKVLKSTTTVEFGSAEETSEERSTNLQATKDNTNVEASFTDSLHLDLTQSDHKCDNNVPLLQENIEKASHNVIIKDERDTSIKETDKLTGKGVDSEPIRSETPDGVSHTQLEVIFDDSNLPVEEDNVRPSNPILNVLTASERIEESVEDKLAKMFQSQVELNKSNKDDIFLQPTQVVGSTSFATAKDDIFLLPTQLVSTNLLDNSNCKTNNVENVKTPEKDVRADKIDDDDIFLQPTQIVAPEYQKPVIILQKTEISNGKETEDDIFLKPTQVICCDKIDNINSKNSAAGSEDKVMEEVIKPTEDNEDNIFMQATQIVRPKSTKLINFLNSLSIEASDNENTDLGDHNLVQKEQAKFSNIRKRTNEKTLVNQTKNENGETPKTDSNRRFSKRNAIKQGNKSVKKEEIVVQNSSTRKSSIRLNSNNTDTEDADIKKNVNDNAAKSVLTSKKSFSNDVKKIVPEVEKVSTTDEKTLSEHKWKKKANKSSKEDNTSSTITRINTRSVPSGEITNKTLETKKKRANSYSLENELISTNVSTRSKIGQELKGADNNSTVSKMVAVDKVETPNIPTDTVSDQNKSTPTDADTAKIPVNQAAESSVKKYEETPQRSSAKGRKTKQKIDENIITKKKSKVEALKTNESNPLRRSRRKKSEEEGIETSKNNSQKKELNVIREKSMTPIESGTTNSEDEFMDANSTTPQTTRRSRKQTLITTTKKDIKSDTQTARSRASVTNTRSKKIKKAEDVDQTEPNKDVVISSAEEIKSRKQTLTEDFSTDEIDKDIVDDQVKRYTRKRTEPSPIDTHNRTTTSKKAKVYQNEEDDFRVKRDRTPSTPLSSTPEATKRILKPKVIFTMLDSPELETIIRSLGGFVVDSIETSTVLVTSSVKRSQKLLSAIGLAKPICSPKWLHDSKSANMFLDPWQYIMEDEDAEAKWNFSLKESLNRSSNNKLLENYTFQIMAISFQDVLKGSIESCGGKCVSRAPSKNNQKNFVIIATPENKNKYNRFLKQNPAPKVVAPEAIFDGVLRQELHLEDHLLI
ncbi:hypothetical protein Trydic_g15476 [Trypoxylus dichotomus]